MIEVIKISLEDLQLRVDRRETNNCRQLIVILVFRFGKCLVPS